VPQDGQLGKNQKRAGHDILDIYYWIDCWPHFTDLLRNEKPVHFQYDDSNNTAQISSVRATVPGGSFRFAERFIKAHLFPDKLAKKIYSQPCAAMCRPIRVRDQPQNCQNAQHQNSSSTRHNFPGLGHQAVGCHAPIGAL
jgi:hypothetical protein